MIDIVHGFTESELRGSLFRGEPGPAKLCVDPVLTKIALEMVFPDRLEKLSASMRVISGKAMYADLQAFLCTGDESYLTAFDVDWSSHAGFSAPRTQRKDGFATTRRHVEFHQWLP